MGYRNEWEELHASQILNEREAMARRNEMNDILSMEQKIDILFALQMDKLSDSRVISLHKKMCGGGCGEK